MYMLHRVWEVWRNLKLFTRPLINAKHLQYVAFIFSSFLFTFIWDFWRGLYTCHDICVKVKGQFTGVCSMLHCGSNSSCQPWPLGASTSWATLMTLFSCVCVLNGYVCMHMCTPICSHPAARGGYWESCLSFFTLLLWDRVSLWTWS